MLTIEKLREFGADVDDGLKRCVNNEQFYLTLVNTALKEESYTAVESAVESHDLTAAFEAAHALKGVLTNLALTPIAKPVIEMTELLRSRTDTDYSPYLKEIRKKKNELDELAK